MDYETIKHLFEKLLLIRECENTIVNEYHLDEIKTPVHLSIGAEAISVGASYIFGSESKYLGTYRSHAPYLATTDDVEGFFAELYGTVSSPMKGKSGSMHLNNIRKNFILSSAVVGTPLPVSLGISYSIKLRKEDHFCVCFIGDGATEEGSFWESLNFACLKKLPLIIVVENNGLAIHSHIDERQSHYGLESICQSYPIQYESCQGEDIFDVIRAFSNAKEMSKDSGPALIESSYHRFYEHVGVGFDYEVGYREPPDSFAKLDPIEVLKKELVKTDAQSIHKKVVKRIERAKNEAKKSSPPNPTELGTNIYNED